MRTSELDGFKIFTIPLTTKNTPESFGEFSLKIV
jgi:hypothetical protein